ncbi:Fic family protein [Stutzerimonas nosocomialis]|uniref:Fic family protein n=1 Tax=Stutzerimonas nosocomialis TaxID=1056496 RepID=A0A5R9QBT5_9GAMM|nr:Fic family protein [Stutzerimonas nosocomialis]TLX62440.1 Fic family protein [Stutzerimonas nosocomialis]
MVKMPPAVMANPFTDSALADRVSDYMELCTPLDKQGRYLHYDKLRFRLPPGLNHSVAWSIVKFARNRQLTPILELGDPVKQCKLMLTPAIQKAISESDRHTTSAALEWMCSNIGEQRHLEYLLNDLIEDEAISSSQLEGAATTTKVAKDLLKRQRGPRTPDEKMIIGNYRMMQCAWKCRDQELSIELITELHQVGVEGIDDERYFPGVLRDNDDVVVEDGDGNVVHTPPPAAGLEARLKRLAEWVNTDHAEVATSSYIHPLVKAMILHFSIGYEHPFRDGNGRVARSLFYWYLFKNNFGAFRYIAISTLLKAASGQYGKSYLYTESDQMDLTYFADFQSRIVIRAISEFKKAYQKTMDDMQKFNVFLYNSGLFGKLSDKQKVVLQVAKSGTAHEFTAVNVKENLGCSYNTASTVLNGLVEMKLFRKRKQGREWVFTMLPTKEIIKTWSEK